jgi:hypothetical protein
MCITVRISTTKNIFRKAASKHGFFYNGMIMNKKDKKNAVFSALHSVLNGTVAPNKIGLKVAWLDRPQK